MVDYELLLMLGVLILGYLQVRSCFELVMFALLFHVLTACVICLLDSCGPITFVSISEISV